MFANAPKIQDLLGRGATFLKKHKNKINNYLWRIELTSPKMGYGQEYDDDDNIISVSVNVRKLPLLGMSLFTVGKDSTADPKFLLVDR